MAYYYAQQSCAPVDISAVYNGLTCGPDDPLQVEVWISSILKYSLNNHIIRWRIYNTSGQIWAQNTQTVNTPANNSAKFADINWNPSPEMIGDVALLYLELLDPAQTVIAQNLYTFGIQKPKETFPQGLSICKEVNTNHDIKFSPWQTQIYAVRPNDFPL